MGERVLEFGEALAVVLGQVRGLAAGRASERVALDEVAGRVLAEALLADRDQPPFHRATRDGFALRAADAGAALQVVGQVRAGESWRGAAVGPGQALEIMTGAPLPEGADAVVMVEHTSRDEGALRVEAGRTLRAGENVVQRGAEARAGDVVLPMGRAMGAAEIAVAASCGAGHVRVFVRPKVAVVATGDELVELDAKHTAGAKAPFKSGPMRPEAEASGYLSGGGAEIVEPEALGYLSGGGAKIGEAEASGYMSGGGAKIGEAEASGYVSGGGAKIGGAEASGYLSDGRAEIGEAEASGYVSGGGLEIGEAQIYNSNSYALAALVRSEGGLAARLPVAKDSFAELRERIKGAMAAEVVLLSGGVSMGKYDLVEEVLAELGAEFFFTGAMIQPGKPVVFGRLPTFDGARPWVWFFGLPGNPVSTQVCFHLFVAPLLRGLAGRTEIAPRFVEARLKEAVAGGKNVTRFLPAELNGAWDKVSVRVVGWQGSGDVAAHARGDCYCVLPSGVAGFAAGETVRVLLR